VATSRKSVATAGVVRRATIVNVKTDIEDIKLRVQATLDELISEHLITFKVDRSKNRRGRAREITLTLESGESTFLPICDCVSFLRAEAPQLLHSTSGKCHD
jgi:hypothetical protein